MAICCRLCGQEFPKIIPWQHLRGVHEISGSEYRKQFGSTISPETQARQRARTPHNKGQKVTDPQRLTKIHQALARREQRYAAGELTRGGWSHTADARTRISEGVQEYARQHSEELTSRAKQASATRQAQGNHSSGMLGKHHTEETISKILASTQQSRATRKTQTLERRRQYWESLGVRVIHLDHQHIVCQCERCDFEFTRSFSNSNPQKIQKNLHVLCPQCRIQAPRRSQAEQELAVWVQTQTPYPVRVSDRTTIAPWELDIVIPEQHLALEYCGLYWHSELSGGKSPSYHQEKWRRCRDQDIQLITVFEDEWLLKPQLVQSLIQRRLGVVAGRVAARKCEITQVSVADARAFLTEHHIHGYAKSNLRLGLVFEDQLVYVMTFSQNNLSRRVTEWEIQRMAGQGQIVVQGGASRLFQAFCQAVQPETVVSYADLRWFTGNSYAQLGFSWQTNTTPGYWYFQPPDLTRHHRFSLRKNSDDAADLTEWQNRQNQGWDRIWDCGQARWQWRQK